VFQINIPVEWLSYVPDLRFRVARHHPRVETFIYESEDVNYEFNKQFVVPELVVWYNWGLFFYMFPMYWLIIMNENAPEFNFVQGCHDAWYGQISGFVEIYGITQKIIEGEITYVEPVSFIAFIKSFSFLWMTILEYLYPQMAYCETSWF